MSHMVIYRGADGKPGYHQAEEIHDAISFVESLRNEQGVDHARIFRMEEVRFEYRPYFRVEIAGEGGPDEAPAQPSVSHSSGPASSPSTPVVTAPDTPAVSSPSTASEPPSSVATAAEEAGTAATADAEASDNGIGARRGLFGR